MRTKNEYFKEWEKKEKEEKKKKEENRKNFRKEFEKIFEKIILVCFYLFLMIITFGNIYVFSYVHANMLIEGLSNEIGLLSWLLLGNALLFSVLSYLYWDYSGKK